MTGIAHVETSVRVGMSRHTTLKEVLDRRRYMTWAPEADPRGPKAHFTSIATREPDTMWGADMITTVTAREGTVHPWQISGGAIMIEFQLRGPEVYGSAESGRDASRITST
jgi:hypothetical protein